MALSDPTQLAPDPTQQTTTSPLTRPAPTGGASALPIAPATSTSGTPTTQPIGPTTPVASPLPIAPPPLATSDPMAFAPTTPSAPYTAPTGQTFVGGTQTTDPTTGAVTGSGVLGYGMVPGASGSGLIDLGGGQVAPGDNSGQGTLIQLAPQYTAGYQAPGTMTNQGRIIGMTYDADGNPTPVFDNSTVDPNAPAPTQAAPLSTGQQMGAFLSLLSGAPSAANGGGAATTPIPAGAGSDTGNGAGTGGDVSLAGPLSPAGGVPGAGTPNANPGANPNANPSANPSTNPSAGQAGIAGIAGGAGSAGGASGPGYTLSPTDPNNPLTAQTILPGAGLDFLGQAQKMRDDWIAQTDPQYQAALRDANRYAFASGRGGSGIENNSLGDLALQRQNSIRSAGDQFLANAMGTQNENNYRNIGVLQEQQGFQNQQQQEAFGDALQQLLVGSQGDPSQVALVLSQIFGSQGGGLANAASQYANSQTANTNSQLSSQQFMNWLQQMMNRMGGASTPPIISDVPPIETVGTYGYPQ